MKSKLVKKLSLEKEYGCIYFIDDNGNVAIVSEVNVHSDKKIIGEVIRKTRIDKKEGFVYFVDAIGDVRRSCLMDKDNRNKPNICQQN